MRALAWLALTVLPALSVAAEGTIKVDGVKDGRPLVLTAERHEKIGGLALTGEVQVAALGAGATAR